MGVYFDVDEHSFTVETYGPAWVENTEGCLHSFGERAGWSEFDIVRAQLGPDGFETGVDLDLLAGDSDFIVVVGGVGKGDEIEARAVRVYVIDHSIQTPTDSGLKVSCCLRRSVAYDFYSGLGTSPEWESRPRVFDHRAWLDLSELRGSSGTRFITSHPSQKNDDRRPASGGDQFIINTLIGIFFCKVART
ncbi:hypothetical protein JW710_04930 [Candidatus Dojkabacteria bacterium]|nr:hypothetical protein [Candidatus Dojkabacteria bacterium]